MVEVLLCLTEQWRDRLSCLLHTTRALGFSREPAASEPLFCRSTPDSRLQTGAEPCIGIGDRRLEDKSQNGSLTLAPGEHVRFRYRVIVHQGASRSRCDALYKEYARTKPAPQ